MLRILLCAFCLFVFPLSAFANSYHIPPKGKIKRVIYITFDGTRWQDVFLDHSRLPKFWEKHAKNANFYGMPDTDETMEVASIPVSLPSYQSQMTGAVQTCDGNDCGRVSVETFPEALMHKLKLKDKEVASFASWGLIDYSVQHEENTTFTNMANEPLYDPDTHVADPVMYELNMQQERDFPEFGVRYDKYTFAQAFHYLETYLPRFMWISLNDSDEAAHQGDLDKYHRSLLFFDDALDVLLTKLKDLHIDDETMIIVTTDHGRGDGANWKSHGRNYPESKRTWAFVINGSLKPVSQEGSVTHYSTLSIRPTVEEALGVVS